MTNEDCHHETEVRERNLRRKFIMTISDGISFHFTYFFPLIFSSIIATLGLLSNNTAVIIGAMLIAPLYWPIVGVSYGVVTVRGTILQRSLLLLGISIILVLMISAGITSIIPIYEISEEITARINPTVLDMFIALVTSVIGVIALYWPQISAAVAGVALAVSLLPPLCTAGIGLALGSWEIMSGAGLLFSANMGAIVFADSIVLYFLHFRPNGEQKKHRWHLGLALVFIFVVVISVPLTLYFRRALKQAEQNQIISKTLTEMIAETTNLASLDTISISYNNQENTTYIKATVLVPEGVIFTVDEQNAIADALAKKAKNSIDLELNVVNTLRLNRQEDEAQRQKKEEITQYVASLLADLSIADSLERVDISLATDTAPVQIRMVIRQDGAGLTYDQKKQLTTSLETSLGEPVILDVELIPVRRIQEPDEASKLQERVKRLLLNELYELSPAISLDMFEMFVTADGEESIELTATIRIASDFTFTTADQELIQNRLAEELDMPVQLEIRLLRFDMPQEQD